MSAGLLDQPRMLREPDAAGLLAEGGIPYVEHGVAGTADEAVAIAERTGYPVVLKVVSEDIVHKTEAGGVITGLGDEGALRDGFVQLMATVRARRPEARIDGALVARQVRAGRELIIGAVHDATFGPTVMVGLGGVFAEALDDVSFRLAPLQREDALDMLRELRGFALLGAHRGEGPVDLDAVAGMAVRVGDLVSSHPEIVEIDLNPVAVSEEGCVALDARIIVKDTGVETASGRGGEMAKGEGGDIVDDGGDRAGGGGEKGAS
ncbi:MAG TPA: acetate--CoA ligase family protein [Thermoleophilia bacterium]|nr:acetate--CoA ligase family protein [Thermoleophilia bacterium]